MFDQSPILRWRKYNEKYLLQGNKCLKCKSIYYPSNYICTCGSQSFAKANLKGIGTLLSFTQITISPKAFKHMTPYLIGIIELPEGPKIISQICDTELENLKIGMKVQAVFRKFYESGGAGTINYGLKFIPFEIDDKTFNCPIE